MSAAVVSLSWKPDGDRDGPLFSVGGTSFDDFQANLISFLGEEAAATTLAWVKSGLGKHVNKPEAGPDMQQAVANVQQGLPGAQSVPQPQQQNIQPQQQGQAPPPDCVHPNGRVHPREFRPAKTGQYPRPAQWICDQEPKLYGEWNKDYNRPIPA